MDWFLYDRDLRYERVKGRDKIIFPIQITFHNQKFQYIDGGYTVFAYIKGGLSAQMT